MSHENFMRMTKDKAWKFIEEIAKKTMQWVGFHEKSLTINPTSKGGLHLIENSIATEVRIAAPMRRIKELEFSKRNPPQLDHVN